MIMPFITSPRELKQNIFPLKENTASSTVIFGNRPIYYNSMCNGTEYNFDDCQLPRLDSNSTCAAVGTVNCTEGSYTYLKLMGHTGHSNINFKV